MTEDKSHRDQAFQQATKGLSNWRIALALNLLKPSIDWRSSTKGDMRQAFLGQSVFSVAEFSCDELRDAILRIQKLYEH